MIGDDEPTPKFPRMPRAERRWVVSRPNGKITVERCSIVDPPVCEDCARVPEEAAAPKWPGHRICSKCKTEFVPATTVDTWP